MSKTFKPVKAVLFDMDGLLLNTEPIYEKVFEEVCEKYGKKLTSEVRVKLLGSTEKRSCEVCVNDLKLNVTLDQFIQDFQKLSHQRLANVEFMPGAKALIQHLHANNIPICVATSSGDTSVTIKTKNHLEIFQLFHHITKGSDPELKEGKPAPDIFLLAASRFDSKFNPIECLVLEDSPNGVQGAVSANMQVVMVPADYISEELKSKATLAINSLELFQPEIFGLPAFK
ncbi:CLUMA_CG016295, isoform A [Clunio marinus]|uniref:pseudouridine 5'-phosphatase n=1 Tax=Clunio marinus TaxID=568069 RepID=A0A1J1ITT8_9DIPT|nr:CLUMA_CG016295, isoform A [Clunio marinus]